MEREILFNSYFFFLKKVSHRHSPIIISTYNTIFFKKELSSVLTEKGNTLITGKRQRARVYLEKKLEFI